MTLSQLIACCGSSAWANAMFSRQPFADKATMHAVADELWWSLTADDWLEAFSRHPKIGEKSSSQWSRQEQSGMNSAAVSAADEMARLNAEYFSKFGFIFIVCATGKTADEMLHLLRTRVMNTPQTEIRNAAAEQAKIMHLRLDKVVEA